MRLTVGALRFWPVLLLGLGALLVAPPTANGQVACKDSWVDNPVPPVVSCGGTCPTLVDAGGVPVAAAAVCQKVKTGAKACECYYARAETGCSFNPRNNKCQAKPQCPQLYRSAADARAQRNGVNGKCELVAPPNTCNCVYRFQ